MSKGVRTLEYFEPELLLGDRLDAGMTQGELARRSGIPPSNISHWESGIHIPSRKQYRKVIKVLDKAEDESPSDWIWRRYNPTWSMQHEDDWQYPDD